MGSHHYLLLAAVLVGGYVLGVMWKQPAQLVGLA